MMVTQLANDQEALNTIELTGNNQYRVYYIIDDIEGISQHHLQDFKSFQKAEQFCKEQYFLQNQTFPFISTGYGSGYHPTGSRPSFDVSHIQVNKPKIYEHNDDAHGYFLILSPKEEIQTYSAGVYDVWK